MAQLDLGSGTPGQIISGTTAYVSENSLAELFKGLIGSGAVGVMFAVLDIFDSIIDFLASPLNSAGDAIGALFNGLLEAPASILGSSAGTTSREISQAFQGFLGPFAFPVSVASVLAGLYLVSIYLEQPDTSDLFPGAFSDVNTPDWAQRIGVPELGSSEEDEDNEQDEGS